MKNKINGIDLVRKSDGSIWIYRNTRNNASITVSNHGDIGYSDSVGNYMTSCPRNIRVNFKHFTLRNYGYEIRSPDGTRMIMLPKAEIQEIANNTFYEDGQFHAVDFLTFKITEEN